MLKILYRQNWGYNSSIKKIALTLTFGVLTFGILTFHNEKR